MLPESVRDITVNVLRRLGHMTGTELVKATHAEEPWRRATNEGRCIANQVIPHQSLSGFFRVEPGWVRQIGEHVAATRTHQEFVPDPPGDLDAVIAKHFSG